MHFCICCFHQLKTLYLSSHGSTKAGCRIWDITSITDFIDLWSDCTEPSSCDVSLGLQSPRKVIVGIFFRTAFAVSAVILALQYLPVIHRERLSSDRHLTQTPCVSVDVLWLLLTPQEPQLWLYSTCRFECECECLCVCVSSVIVWRPGFSSLVLNEQLE